jgi:hypothetical protein
MLQSLYAPVLLKLMQPARAAQAPVVPAPAPAPAPALLPIPWPAAPAATPASANLWLVLALPHHPQGCILL